MTILKDLTDERLLEKVSKLARLERTITVALIEHLREIDRRKVYTDLGYSSLFDYCRKELYYSDGAAQRRVTATRLLAQIPEIASKISSGELSLSVICQAQTFFREESKANGKVSVEKKKEVLNLLCGKTSRESEIELLRISSRPKTHALEKTRMITPELMQIQFPVDSALMKQLEKIKGLLAHKYPHLTWAELFKKMAEITLNELDPTNRPQRVASPTTTLIKNISVRSRSIPRAQKRTIWEKFKGKCCNCGSRYALEIDHIEPWAFGGKTSLENLRLLCRSCNQRKAILSFGLDKIELEQSKP